MVHVGIIFSTFAFAEILGLFRGLRSEVKSIVLFACFTAVLFPKNINFLYSNSASLLWQVSFISLIAYCSNLLNDKKQQTGIFLLLPLIFISNMITIKLAILFAFFCIKRGQYKFEAYIVLLGLLSSVFTEVLGFSTSTYLLPLFSLVVVNVQLFFKKEICMMEALGISLIAMVVSNHVLQIYPVSYFNHIFLTAFSLIFLKVFLNEKKQIQKLSLLMTISLSFLIIQNIQNIENLLLLITFFLFHINNNEHEKDILLENKKLLNKNKLKIFVLVFLTIELIRKIDSSWMFYFICSITISLFYACFLKNLSRNSVLYKQEFMLIVFLCFIGGGLAWLA